MKLSFVPIGVVQLLLPAVIEEAEYVDYEPFIAQWSTYYAQQEAFKQRIQDVDKLRSDCYEQRGKSFDRKQSLTNHLNDLQKEFDQVFAAIKNESTSIPTYEQSACYQSQTAEMVTLNGRIQRQLERIDANNREVGFWDKVKGAVSNLSEKNELKKLKDQLAVKEHERVWEVISMQPSNLKLQCEKIDCLKEEMKKLREEIQKENDRYLQLNSEFTSYSSKIEKLEKELKQYQKTCYGLKDIE